MLSEYLNDALVGQDKDFAEQLLCRRAPAKYFAKFYFYMSMHKIGVINGGFRETFFSPLPLHVKVE